MKNRDDAKLCYVQKPWAFFTTQDVAKQWGDDWNDAPYEHNAGWPYEWYLGEKKEPWNIIRVAFDSPHETPCDGAINSRWSVQQINAGAIAWLFPSSYDSNEKVKPIYAGVTLAEFRTLIRTAGGVVYEDRA